MKHLSDEANKLFNLLMDIQNPDDISVEHKDEVKAQYQSFKDYVLSLENKIENYERALTPSGDTKTYHIGEYSFPVQMTDLDEYGEEVEYTAQRQIPWTSVKDIMKRIKEDAERV